MTQSFTAYMCMTDFDHDARGASDGAKVYPSEGALRAERRCVAECGIVEVTVSLARVVQEADFSRVIPNTEGESA